MAFLTRSIDETLRCLCYRLVWRWLQLVPRRAAPRVAAQRIVYIGTYTGETSKGIYAFRFDDGSGELTPIGLVAETPSPSFLIARRRWPLRLRGERAPDFWRRGERKRHRLCRRSNDRQADRSSTRSRRRAPGPVIWRSIGPGAIWRSRTTAAGTSRSCPSGPTGGFRKAVTVVTGQNAETGTAKPLGHYGGLRRHKQVSHHGRQGLESDARVPLRRDNGQGHSQYAAVRAASRDPDHATSRCTRTGSGSSRLPNRPPRSRRSSGTARPAACRRRAACRRGPRQVTRRIDRRDCPASQREVRLRLQSRTRQHRCFQHWRRGRAEASSNTSRRAVRRRATSPSTRPARWLIAANQRSGTLAVFTIDQNTGALTPSGQLWPVGAPCACCSCRTLCSRRL